VFSLRFVGEKGVPKRLGPFVGFCFAADRIRKVVEI
jgi:hypothetical protein